MKNNEPQGSAKEAQRSPILACAPIALTLENIAVFFK